MITNYNADKPYIYEIFKSISGEVGEIPQGSTAIFIRFMGCNLACPYCDSPHTQSILFTSKYVMYISTIAKQVEELNCPNVIITGGEPLLQRQAVLKLISHLTKNPKIKNIQIETNGTFKADFKALVSHVFDFKLNAPEKMLPFEYFAKRPSRDWLKIVVMDQDQFDRALLVFNAVRSNLSFFRKNNHIRFAISSGTGNHAELSTWIMEAGERANGIVQNIQLHKIMNIR